MLKTAQIFPYITINNISGGKNGDSDALTPFEATQDAFETGLHHLDEPLQLVFFKMFTEDCCCLWRHHCTCCLYRVTRIIKVKSRDCEIAVGPRISHWTDMHLLCRS